MQIFGITVLRFDNFDFSTCFEPESPSSGRLLYIQLGYGAFFIHSYKKSGGYQTAYTTVFLKMNPWVRNM
jgi:hypothetical protein